MPYRRVVRLEVSLTPSQQVASLQQQVVSLRERVAQLQANYNRVELLYRSECIVNMELTDLLNEHGIPFRDAIKGLNL